MGDDWGGGYDDGGYDTGGGDYDTGGGDYDTGGGDYDTGGGNYDTAGDYDTGGGDYDIGGFHNGENDDSPDIDIHVSGDTYNDAGAGHCHVEIIDDDSPDDHHHPPDDHHHPPDDHHHHHHPDDDNGGSDCGEASATDDMTDNAAVSIDIVSNSSGSEIDSNVFKSECAPEHRQEWCWRICAVAGIVVIVFALILFAVY